MNSERAKAIRMQLYADTKIADNNYTAACGEANLPMPEAIREGMEVFLDIVISNGFALEMTKVISGWTSDGVYSKEEFIGMCSDVYDKVYPKCQKLVDTVQQQIAASEAENAVKN